MNIEDSSKTGKLKLLDAIAKGLNEHFDAMGEQLKSEDFEEDGTYALEAYVTMLDDLDCDDFFGTEGWKHSFGVE